MSNSLVGNVYQQIIQDVIDASKVDFEEAGVDEGVLDELKQVSDRLQIRVSESPSPHRTPFQAMHLFQSPPE